jgi:dipeptidyl aminopeptidase/acylaminoacyl peptidase
VSAAANGSLGYASAPSTNTVAEWYDVSGRRTGTLPLPPGYFQRIAISPDGKYGVATRVASPSESSLWLIDLATGAPSRLTAGSGSNGSPVWSPDATKIVFTSDRDGAADMFVKTIASSAPEAPFYRSSVLFKFPSSWTPDGKWIVTTQVDPGSAQNVYLLPAADPRELQLFARGPVRELGGAVSPDGKWMITFSDETGRYQLYIDSFPTPGRRIQVSKNGALLAWWTPDGRQLLFSDETRGLWRAGLTFSPAPSAGVPQLLAQLPSTVLWSDFMPDRQKFLVLAQERSGPGSITVVQNWRAALARP